MSEYTPGTYVKGDSVRIANTPARAVALAFEGYKLKSAEPVADTSVEEPVEVAQIDETAPDVALESHDVFGDVEDESEPEAPRATPATPSPRALDKPKKDKP